MTVAVWLILKALPAAPCLWKPFLAWSQKCASLLFAQRVVVVVVSVAVPTVAVAASLEAPTAVAVVDFPVVALRLNHVAMTVARKSSGVAVRQLVVAVRLKVVLHLKAALRLTVAPPSVHRLSVPLMTAPTRVASMPVALAPAAVALATVRLLPMVHDLMPHALALPVRPVALPVQAALVNHALLTAPPVRPVLLLRAVATDKALS